MRTCACITTLLLAATACGDSPVENAEITECTGSAVTATAGAGTTPTFDWSPRCLVAGVLIEPTEVGQGGDRWLITGTGNSIAPTLTYGVLPSGAELVSGPNPLSTGADYRIILWHDDGQGTETVIANRSFTP